MYACDFEYDGHFLSDYGFIICTFGGSSDLETASAGSQITFNKVSRHRGKKYSLTSTQYEECIECTFYICKDPSRFDDFRITEDEHRNIIRWLNRREFLKLHFLYDERDREECYYKASFNIQKMVIDGALYGFELNMTTDSPFGYGEDITIAFTTTTNDSSYYIYDVSDEIGYTYPKLQITPSQSGSIQILNATISDTESMLIKNCQKNEVITIDGESQIISSSLNSHKIYNDFNWNFLKLTNSLDERENQIIVSYPCKIQLTYTPIIKVSPN